MKSGTRSPSTGAVGSSGRSSCGFTGHPEPALEQASTPYFNSFRQAVTTLLREGWCLRRVATLRVVSFTTTVWHERRPFKCALYATFGENRRNLSPENNSWCRLAYAVVHQ